MIKRLLFIGSLLASVSAFGSAHAQATTKVVGTCGTQTYVAGSMQYPTQDTTGSACSSGGGGGGGGVAGFTAVSGGSLPVVAGTNKPAAIDLFSHLGVVNYDTSGNALDPNAALPAGSNIIGNVRIDQTTPGTTNGVVINSSALPSGAATETSLAKLTQTQGSTTSGQSGPLAQCAATTAAPTYTTATTNPLNCTTSGEQRGNVQGPTAAATVDSTSKPVQIGGRQSGTDAVRVLAVGSDGSIKAAALGQYNTSLPTLSAGTGANQVNMSVNGGLMTAETPTTDPNVAIVPVISTAAESSHVLKGGAGNLYRLVVTTGASAGYVMVFNATSAPADGAVTPQMCRSIAATSSLSMPYEAPPSRFTTGITAVFSITGCFTKTASATASFEGYVQ